MRIAMPPILAKSRLRLLRFLWEIVCMSSMKGKDDIQISLLFVRGNSRHAVPPSRRWRPNGKLY
jgi:hypothetical protein